MAQEPALHAEGPGESGVQEGRERSRDEVHPLRDGGSAETGPENHHRLQGPRTAGPREQPLVQARTDTKRLGPRPPHQETHPRPSLPPPHDPMTPLREPRAHGGP